MTGRTTLQECIQLFNSNPMLQYAAVRNMETLGEWRAAKEYWLKLGRIEDAKACELVIETTEMGNAYRAATKHLNDWVDQTVEQGIMTRDEAVKVIYPEMQKIYNQYVKPF